MSITNDRLRVIRTNNAIGNDALTECGQESLILDVSHGGLYVGKENNGGYPDIIATGPIIEILYDELVDLRDNSKLIPVQQYRITDYITTTSQDNTQSAGHQFDIIVTADDKNTLNEIARACLHEGDTYFTENSANLEAWKMWYCLDNDTNRFAWADEENGKGVIYRMIDEWNNDCPYDFKNIMFYRESLPENIDIPGFKNDEYYYTFTWIDSDENITDMTLTGQTLLNDEGYCPGVHDNKISNCSAYALYLDGKTEPFLLALSKNVFISTYAYDSGLFYGCYGNSLSINCHSNTFGNYCYYNTFGSDCYYNTFGNDCYSNTFGNHCDTNIFGNCSDSNTFGNHCYYNTFGSDCYYNTFGNDCHSNTFGSDCYYNTFGNWCHSNTFGSDCYYNTFGNWCHSNTFGNTYNTGEHYYRYFALGDGTQYIIFKNTATASINNYVQNYKTTQGLQGTESNKLTVDVTRGLSYETTIAFDTKGNIKQYVESELGIEVEFL